MRIGIDARTILNPEKGDSIGTGHYTYQLIRNLLDIDKENEYVLFFDFRVREKDVKKFTRPNVKICFYPFSDYKKYLPGAYNEILGSATLHREKLDLVHSTSPTSRIPTSYNGKLVVTVHDLAVYKVPEVFPKLYRTKTRAVINLMVGKAQKIIAVSNSTRRDICEIFECPENKIETIYGGLDKRFFDPGVIPFEKLVSKFDLKKRYILFLGTLEPVKNISRLLEAFKNFSEYWEKQKDRREYQLVIGGKRGWLASEYKQIIEDMGLDKKVVFTGYVVGDELVPLFHGAEFFVMPSLYEGFGTTVLEALATQTPAIVSNVSSIPEIAKDAAILVNPLDTKAIAQAMIDLSKNEEMKQQLRQKGLEQAKKFDWKKCAEETLRVYNSMKK
jgi:glycosyltransferase involved in cell wall biosynthesis